MFLPNYFKLRGQETRLTLENMKAAVNTPASILKREHFHVAKVSPKARNVNLELFRKYPVYYPFVAGVIDDEVLSQEMLAGFTDYAYRAAKDSDFLYGHFYGHVARPQHTSRQDAVTLSPSSLTQLKKTMTLRRLNDLTTFDFAGFQYSPDPETVRVNLPISYIATMALYYQLKHIANDLLCGHMASEIEPLPVARKDLLPLNVYVKGQDTLVVYFKFPHVTSQGIEYKEVTLDTEASLWLTLFGLGSLLEHP